VSVSLRPIAWHWMAFTIGAVSGLLLSMVGAAVAAVGAVYRADPR
jgi:hypothetical protein